MNDFVLSNTQPGMQAKVLVISDDHDSARIWCHILNEKNIDATLLGSPEEALQVWSEMIPDLIVIDIYSRGFDGVGLVGQLREQGVMPIILLTAINNETHILEAYQAGVDECVVKPISPTLFQAKVKAWLRRTWSMPAESLDMLQVGGLRLDPTHRQVTTEDERVVKLTNLEFRLLHLLMTHPGWVLTSEDIVQKVWGYHGNGDSSLLKNVVYRLRRKIDPDPGNPRYIHTETGLGYKFQDSQN
ncbi:MAG: response regulator transcription factor [Anaerolineales bacterium]|nr:response regulator transcription factor [Anaerolineales bacterium]